MKKFIALASALALIIFTCSISVFAEDNEPMTTREYYEQIDSLIAAYCNREIDFDTFNTSQQDITDRFYSENCDGLSEPGSTIIAATNNVAAVVEKMGSTVNNYNDAAQDVISGLIGGLFDPYRTTEQVNTSSSTAGIDIPAGGCGVIWRQYAGVSLDIGDYYIITSSQPGKMYDTYGIIYGPLTVIYYDASMNSTRTYTVSGGGTYYKDDGYHTSSFCGTWLNASDGSPADTDDTYGIIQRVDFSDATEPELIDLLDDILTVLENENPDFDTTEDTLKAIYYKLKIIEEDQISKDDLEQLINSAIDKLNSHECDHSGIIALLEEIRDNNKNYNKDWEKYREKILAYLYPGSDDVTKAQEFATSVKGLFYTKFSFIDEFKTFFSGLSWGSPSSIKINLVFNGTTHIVDTSAFDSFMPAIRYMLAFFIYGLFAIRSFKRMPGIVSSGGDE